MSQTLEPTITAPKIATVREQINRKVDDLLAFFPEPDSLSPAQRRGILARYTAVLEGNFIYWMSGAHITVSTDVARAEIMENLLVEVRDCHPGMMRRFAIGANAMPTDSDHAAVYHNLSKVRDFVGQLSTVRLLLMLMYFEGFIQRFMPYLAELARLEGSQDFEYTDVHGVCDAAHTEGLYEAVKAEVALTGDPLTPESNPLEGVELLRVLMENVAVA